MKRLLCYIGFVLAIGLAFIGGMWVQKQLQIDMCLDRGGRWNHETSTCEGDKVDR